MKAYGEDPNVLLGILRFTAPFNFSGSPTITLPNGFDQASMPLSMQVVGPHLSEDDLAARRPRVSGRDRLAQASSARGVSGLTRIRLRKQRAAARRV